MTSIQTKTLPKKQNQTNTHPMPIGDILVGDATGDIKHDDGALTLDVVPIPEPTEFFLSGGVPHVEFDGTTIREKR